MTFDEIIAAMERGGTGRELDYAIAELIGREAVREHQGSFAPWFYTTSLDASIPGEDIRVVFAPGHEGNDHNKPLTMWAALGAKKGERTGNWAYAPTEALARRIAGLKAWQAAQEAGE